MATVLLLRPQVLRADRWSKPVFRAVATRRHESTLRNYLVTPAELQDALKRNAPSSVSTEPRTIAVCASWFLPNDPHGRTGYEVFKQAHIRKARFWDLDKIADTESKYPHMLPTPEIFQEAMQGFGVNRDDTLVVYDTAELGIFSAPRVAWTLKVFGHPYVHVLNNFKVWVEQKYPVEQGERREFARSDYPLPQLDTNKVVDYNEVRIIALDHNKEGREEIQILDARPEGRFNGTDPEPRPGLPSGHMPGAHSVPFIELLDPKTKAMKSPEELRQVFESKNIDPNKPVISSCGTGVTAAIIDTALVQAGYAEGKVYDGSWTEWAQRVQTSDNFIVHSK